MSKVAFIGLGVMGFPMAGHLKRAGHDVVVYNLTRQEPPNGSKLMADRARRRRARRRPAGTSFSPASATIRT